MPQILSTVGQTYPIRLKASIDVGGTGFRTLFAAACGMAPCGLANYPTGSSSSSKPKAWAAARRFDTFTSLPCSMSRIVA